jgi:bacterioferritin
MKGDRQVIVHLNNVLYNQLTAINQYFLHARMLKDWGIEKLGQHIYKESIHQMKHADKVIERILFLEGLPNLQQLGKLHIGENTREILACDLRMANDSHITLKAAIAYAEQSADFVTRDMLRAIMAEEEEYIDWTGTQLALIESVTLENFIQSQL